MEKTESVLYLKSAMMAMPGKLNLNGKTLTLEAHKQGVGGFGILGSLLKRKVESTNHGFSWTVEDIATITQGKHGAQKNILEVTHQDGQQFRIQVSNFEEWKNAIDASKSV
ncbi:MAG: hypothetical protein E6Q38_04110 [Crocinitomicaceae bacterium]|nr:MAG: hypothetical protein E6Q38_04110 [Crocinitomicaceae bacterium]